MKLKNPTVLSTGDWRNVTKAGKSAALAKSAIIRRAADGTVSFIASTATADRYGDTIDQKGWNTAAFEANPVLLWAHSQSTPPVGKVGKLDKSGDLVAQAVEFTSDEQHPFGAQVGRMVAAGFLNAVSVGFLPKKWEERRDEKGAFLGYHFTEMELLEISVVPVPANPQALLASKAFAMTLGEWVDSIDENAGPITRGFGHEVAGFMKAAGDAVERAQEAADGDLLAELVELQRRQLAETMALRADLARVFPEGAKAQHVAPAASGTDDARDGDSIESVLARIF